MVKAVPSAQRDKLFEALGGNGAFNPSTRKVVTEMPSSLTSTKPNPKNNIILMTDGYKFSHHKQFPVSWLPAQARPSGEADYLPPILFPAKGSGQAAKVFSFRHVPRLPGDDASPYKITIVTSIAT